MTAQPADADVYLLRASFGQERLWLLDRLGTGQAFNICGAVQIRGPLMPALVTAALAAVTDRHEALRTSFDFGPDGGLLQVIHPQMAVPLVQHDLRREPADSRVAAARSIVTQFSAAPFDLASGPLLRAATVRLGDQEWVLAIAVHHIVADGWSIGVLLPELAACYGAAATGRTVDLPELPVQYGDWAVWQRDGIEAAADSHASYWKEQLRGARPPDLPVRAALPGGGAWRGAAVPIHLPAAVLARMGALAEEERVTIFMVLLTALAVALGRWCDQDDIVIATPQAGRGRVEVEGLIGFFLNTLPLRIRLPADISFRDLLRQARDVCLDAYSHQDLPFEKIVEQWGSRRIAGQLPLARVMLALQNLPASAWEVPGLVAEPFEVPATHAQLELALALFEGADGSLAGRAVYAADLWQPADVTGLLGTWRQVLDRAGEQPDQPAAQLSLPGATERARLLNELSGAAADQGAAACVHELIEAAADAAPDALAVTGDTGSLTYRELEARANRGAWYLRAAGIGPDHVVGVCLPRSAGLIVALLAILKAGGAYLPLDPGYPEARLRFLLDDARPDIILTDSSVLSTGLLDRIGGVGGPRGAGGPRAASGTIATALLDDDPAAAAMPATRPGRSACPDNLAYVIYTSGSTGTPKGVQVTHAAIASRSRWTQHAHPLGPGDGMLVRTPVGFDVFGAEWIWPLMAGARAVLARPGGEQDPGYLAGLVAREHVSIAIFVPSALQAFLGAAEVTDCETTLRLLTCGGEELPPDLVERLFRLLPAATLHHEYGPTEAAVNVTLHPVRSGATLRGRIPIGRPLPGVRLYVLDDRGELVPPGVPGNLHIGGVQVARGYQGRPALTAECFVPDPFGRGSRLYRTGDRVRWLSSGDLDFLGRRDGQVKIRGQRIELGEVEAALVAYPGVDRAAVVAVGDRPADRRLIGYLACPGDGPVLDDLRAFLRERLPAAFVPEAFLVLPELPVSANGKLDRAALPEVVGSELRSGRARVPPSTPAEQLLADIWADVLQLAEVGVQDDFYELGGNSLRAVSVFEHAQDKGLLLPLQLMLGNHSIEQLASRVGDQQEDSLHQLEGFLDS